MDANDPPLRSAPSSPSSTDAWAALESEIEASALDDVRVFVGNIDGVIFQYEKGSLPRTERRLVASASKMMVGAAIFRLVERGVLDLEDRPQDYISWWTNDSADPRSRVTLEHLLSLVSGFNARPVSGGCVHEEPDGTEACVQAIYADGVGSMPGEEFHYGPEHLDVATLMAEMASGKTFREIFFEEIIQPFGLSDDTFFGAPDPASGSSRPGAYSTAEDYTKFLHALFRGEVVQDLSTFTQDRTSSVIFVYRPGERFSSTGDWHYALASWRECDLSYYSDPCTASVTLSSPGAFGWIPWIDFENGYYALIAHQDPNIIDSSNSLELALDLEQELQPLIEAALSD